MSNESDVNVEPRVEAWQQRTEWPLTAVAAIFLVAYAWPILSPGLPHVARTACRVTDYGTWVVFAVEYVLRVSLARRRTRYVLRHLPDLAVVALPLLRPLRLLRLVLLLRVLNRQAADSFRGRVVVYSLGSAIVLVTCAALAALDAERGRPGSNINGFGDALWWAFTTVSTVGYGDYYPVTFEGRAVAVGLMIGGVAAIGVVTATFATWLIDRVRDVDEAQREPDLASLEVEVRRLRADIAELRLAILTGQER